MSQCNLLRMKPKGFWHLAWNASPFPPRLSKPRPFFQANPSLGHVPSPALLHVSILPALESMVRRLTVTVPAQSFPVGWDMPHALWLSPSTSSPVLVHFKVESFPVR